MNTDPQVVCVVVPCILIVLGVLFSQQKEINKS